MSTNEPTAKTKSPRTGIFATLRAPLGAKGTGAPRAKLALAAIAILATLVLGVGLAGAVAPVVTIENAKDVEYTTAHVEGEVNPEDHETSFHFEYITDAQYLANEGNAEPLFQGAAEVGHNSLPENAGAAAVSEQLGGLQPGTTYHLRLVATNTEAETVEAVAASTFTTKAVAKPLVSGLAATATEFSGLVNPNAPKSANELDQEPPSSEEAAINGAFATHWRFSCDPGCSFSGPSEGDLKADDSAAEVTAEPTGLTPNQEYDVTLHATNAGGESTETKVAAFKTAVVKPTIARATLFELTRNSIELRASLDPQNASLTDCHFLYGAASLTEHEAPCEDVNERQEVAIGATAGQFRLSFQGEKTKDIAFDASAATVQAALQALPSIGPGNVSVSGGPGEYFGRYPYAITFLGSLSGQNVEELAAENGTVPLLAVLPGELEEAGYAQVRTDSQGGSALERANGSLRVSGLSPATEYHFQLVATNLAGTAEGDIRSFTTPAAPSDEPCPNQAIRDIQRANHLPNCSAWEKVSPADKGHGDIVGDNGTNIASKAGDAVTMSARSSFGDIIGSGAVGQTLYLARRGANGWATHGINPQPQFDARQVIAGSTRFQVFSDDLHRAVVWGYDFPAATDDLPLRNNIYVEDTATRALQTVTALQGDLPDPLPHPVFELGSQGAQWGVSADARHVTFVSRAPYLPAIKQMREENNPPEPPEQGSFTPNVYQWDDGVLSLAGILPDGSVPPSGSDVVPNQYYRDAMSDDGSRQLFVSPPGGNRQLYQRIDGARTAWISEPEGSDKSEPTGVQLRAATPDGRTVFFATSSALLDGDQTPGPDLYRWTDGPDPAHEDDNLTLITHAGLQEDSQILGVSDDGQRVYYLGSDADLKAWDHGTTRMVSDGGVSSGSNTFERLDVTAQPGLARSSPDGRYLAFAVMKAGDSVQGLTGTPVHGRLEMYLYDLENDALNCASCPAGAPVSKRLAGKDAEGIVNPIVTSGVVGYSIPGIRPRFLTNDGSVFFSSPEPLVPGDTNGVLDAYRYDAASGKLSLLSSGTGSDPTSFTDAGANGNDVFLVTRNQLVPSDSDNLVDLYDVRAGGGFDEPIEPPPAPCVGEGCQGSAGQTPPLASPASQAQGRGNVVSRKPSCRKPRSKKQGAKQSAAAKKRCAKRNTKASKKKNSKRAANTNRRTAK